mmetsp:Transcript_6558/g.11496  ORF Transcript_6558/g.11496 Transcript_6558/m.11496 type:complete len:81 (+) Transcript_6558:665-907(+)
MGCCTGKLNTKQIVEPTQVVEPTVKIDPPEGKRTLETEPEVWKKGNISSREKYKLKAIDLKEPEDEEGLAVETLPSNRQR